MTKMYFKRSPKGMPNERAAAVIDKLLQLMEQAVRKPELVDGEEWKKIFGAGGSVVAHVQKLVSAMKALSQLAPSPLVLEGQCEDINKLDPSEVRMLLDWADSAVQGEGEAGEPSPPAGEGGPREAGG